MLSSLLVQLFGREVIDRLDAAGFESDAAIAEQGPDGLVRRAGIAPDLAARIVALASEIPDGDPGTQRPGRPLTPETRIEPMPESEPGLGPLPAPDPHLEPPPETELHLEPPTGPELHLEPLPELELQVEPLPAPDPPACGDSRYPIGSSDLPIEMSAAIESRSQGEGDSLSGPATEESDPFVDAAGLVAWMGFAIKAGPEGALVSSVADRILDKPRAAGTTKPRSSDEPARPQRTQPRVADAGNRITLEGTIWSFGHRPHPGSTRPPTAVSKLPGAPDEAGVSGNDEFGSESERSNPIGFLHRRRRNYDGH